MQVYYLQQIFIFYEWEVKRLLGWTKRPKLKKELIGHNLQLKILYSDITKSNTMDDRKDNPSCK